MRLATACFAGRRKHYTIAFLIQIVLAGFFCHDWDCFVFITTVEQFLQGTSPYQTAFEAPLYTFSPGPPWMQAWYAYPPLPLLLCTATYAPYFYLIGDNPILGRIFLKLGFIAGNLLCAYLVYRLIRGVSSEEKASKAEKMVLYNPFLIFIAAVWGMFDIWVVNFLLLGLLQLRQGKLKTAAVCFGLSVLVKPIALIFAPLLLAHVWNRTKSLTKTTLLVAVAVATFAVVSLPFFIDCPQGFADQVVGVHTDRVPQGLSPLYVLYFGELVGDIAPFQIPSLTVSAISVISIVLLFATVFLISAYYWLKGHVNERTLIASAFLIVLAFILFNKVVNPQYLVIPMVLAIVCIHAYDSYASVSVTDLRRYYRILVIPALLYGILVAGHFVKFIAPDVAMSLMGKTGAQVDIQLAFGFPVSPVLYYSIVCSVGPVLLMSPAIIMAGFILYRGLKKVIPGVSEELAASLVRSRLLPRRPMAERLVTYSLICLLVLVPVSIGAASYAFASKQESPSEYVSFDQEDRLVGTFYYCGWDNSSHDLEEDYDDWPKAGLTPEEGYYESTYAYMEDDIRQMKTANIDFAIVPFRHFYTERYITFAQASEEQEFFFVPMIEPSDLEIYEQPSDWEHPGFTGETKRELIDRIDAVLAEKDSPSYLRYEGKPVLFMHRDSYFPEDTGVPYDQDFWAELRAEVEEQHGDLFWIIDLGWSEETSPTDTFDSGFYLPALAWLSTGDDESAMEAWEDKMEQLSTFSSGPCIASVMPYYNDEEVNPSGGEWELDYDRFWEVALDNDPDILLVFSWNEYFESACIEPTEEFGEEFLERTEYWANEFKST
jgi:Gpi18-like mannosyltransferase